MTGAFNQLYQLYNAEYSLSNVRNSIRDKVSNFIIKNGVELAGMAGEVLIQEMLSTIYDGYSKVIGGNTVGLYAEFSLAFVGAVQSGSMLAFDKSGISLLGYVGQGGAAAIGIKRSVGVFIYGSSRASLIGWGGEVGSEVYFGFGGSVAYMTTGGASGVSVALGSGGKFSLVHGYANRTWEIAGENF